YADPSVGTAVELERGIRRILALPPSAMFNASGYGVPASAGRACTRRNRILTRTDRVNVSPAEAGTSTGTNNKSSNDPTVAASWFGARDVPVRSTLAPTNVSNF